MSQFARRLLAFAAAAILFLAAGSALAEKRFVDSDDAKERDEPQKFLKDYDKLVQGKDSDWVYFPNGSLKSYKSVRVNEFDNNGRDRESRDAAREGREYMEQWLQKQGFDVVEKGSADLVVDGNVFNAWEPSGAARYWGGWAANPGVGLELMIKDKSGAIVGQLRDKSKGSTVRDAVENALEDMAKSISKGK